MMKRFLVLVLLVTMCQTLCAENSYGIKLNPGERLISVNGVPVNSSSSIQSTTVKSTQPAATGTVKKKTGVPASKTVQVATSMYSGSDQQRAQAEANYMARNGIRGHVGGQIGMFEGCGWSTGGTPPTCTPSRSMNLTADATAYGSGGVYRVRAWR
jgi:hypothetical protein